MEGVRKACVLTLLSLSVLLPGVSATWKGEGQPLEYFILDKLPGGTNIGNVAIDYKLNEKFNASTFDSLTFQLDPLQSTKQHLFSVGKETGIVSSMVDIDRDSLCPSENVCLAWLHIKVLPVGLYNDIRIMLEIVDINDHTPYFIQQVINVTFLESAKIGTSVEMPTAIDEDSGRFGVRKYELVSPSTDLFQLDVVKQDKQEMDNPITTLHLKVVGDLHKEEGRRYQLRLVAHDGGNPSKSGSTMINVTIQDVNNHDPRFDNATYIASIKENLPSGSFITEVKARDFDMGENAAISYKLNAETAEKYEDLFQIDSATGQLTTKQELDFEASSMYFLVITAMDNGEISKSSEASVIVRILDENDNSPVITVNGGLDSSGAIEASEDLTTGSFVGHLTVSDQDGGDNGRVECSINSQVFAIEKVYQAQFRIITLTKLDRETQDTYRVSVVCHDLGDEPNTATQHLKIRIKDVNDCPPNFTQEIYNTHLVKDKPLTEPLLKVQATDADLDLNGQINYKVHSNARDIFSVHQSTGEITMKTRVKLDGLSQMQFRVIAYDQGVPSLSSTATVIVNNGPSRPFAQPEFKLSNYEFGVFENVPSESDVGTIALKPARIGQVALNDYEYSFGDKSSDGHDFFIIDSHSGQIKTKVTFDREEQSVYYMAVRAVSKSHPYLSGSVSVTVYIADQNDCGPMVTYPTQTNHTVYVKASTPLDHPMTRVKASDPDLGGNSKLTFAIASGNPHKIFKISTTSGEISLNSDLRTISQTKFTLQIIVSDSGYPRFSTPCTLVIIVNGTHSANSISPRVTSGHDYVNSSHATIVVAVTAACLITVFLVLFAVMIFLIWKRMKAIANKHPQGDKYGYSNMEADLSMASSLPNTSLRHSLVKSTTKDAGVTESPKDGRVSAGVGTGECRQIHEQRPVLNVRDRPRSNMAESSGYPYHIDLDKPRPPNLEKNNLIQASHYRGSSPMRDLEPNKLNHSTLLKSNNKESAGLSDPCDDRIPMDSDESFVRYGGEIYSDEL